MNLLAPLDGLDPAALALRATTVLALATGIAFALRSRSAGARHGLWTATFVLLLALPVAYVTIPRWELPVLPGATDAGLAEIAPSRRSAGSASVARDGERMPGPATLEILEGRSSASPLPAPEAVAAPGPRTVGRPLGGSFLWLVWAAGAGAALISLLAAHLRFAGLRRRGTPVRDPVWLGQLDDVRARVGVSGHVTLVVSRDTHTPMTGGLRRPVIVLPAESREWTSEQRTVVLTHEMIHVRRRDALRQLIGRAALAAYWFHPLGWFASRQAAVSRELACDEEVLSLGTRPSEYASLLLALSERSPRTAPAVLSLAMVQRSQLERRLMSILDPDRPKRSSLLTASAVVALAALGISVAIAQPVPAAREAPPAQEAPPAPPARADVPPEPASAPAVAPTPPTGAETVPEPAPVVPLTALEPLSDSRPPAPAAPSSNVPDIEPPQEAGCRMEGVSGDFSGRMSSDGGRTRISGTYNGDRVIQHYIDDLRLCMRMHGDVEMSEEMDRILSIDGSDSWVVMESEEDDWHRLVITAGSGGLEYAWSVNGSDQAFDAEGQAWRDAMLDVLGGYWQAAQIRGQQAGLRGRIAGYRGEVAGIRGQIAAQHGEVAALRGQLASERGAIAGLRGQMAGHRAELGRLERALRSAESDRERRSLTGEMTALRDRLRTLQAAIEERARDTRISELSSEVDELDVTAEVRELEARLEAYDLDARVAAVEREIDALDADRRVAEIQTRLEQSVERLKRLLDRM